MSDIDVNAIADVLNNKVDLADGTNQASVDYVVESQLPTADNDYTWYRLYKSGWVEQGGQITLADSTNTTVNFPITFSDSNYSWSINGIRTTGADQYAWQCGVYNTKDTGSMQIRNSSNGTMVISWITCGISAQS